MADLTELQARLAEAEAALHALQTGQAVTEVQADNIRTRYAVSLDEGGLTNYINDLRSKIASGVATPSRRAPVGVIFG
jgi:hypothetical protein